MQTAYATNKNITRKKDDKMKEKFLKTNKRILAMIISLAMVMGVISAPQMVIPANASNYSFEVDGLAYNILTDNTVEVAKNLHKSKNVVIPKTVTVSGKTYTVTSIRRLAFDEQGVNNGETIENQIESVEIPDTVKSIGSGAFEICFNLTSVTIPDSVTSIGEGAFYFSGLTSVILSKNLKSIEAEVFAGCKITEVTVPEGVEKIGEEAFGDCNYLTKVILPETMSEVDKNAFAGSKNIKEIIAPIDATFILNDERVISVCDYSIDSNHGTVSLSGEKTTKELFDSNKAVFWDTINVTVTPEAGYQLQSLVIVDNDNNRTYTVYDNHFTVEYSDFTIKATYSGQGTKQNNGTGASNSNSSDSNSSNSGSASNGSAGAKYSSEWVNGKWYNADGSQTYAGTLSWKSNSTGWWVEDSEGWYPTSQWQKIDGIWYYFSASGYMASGEYYNGYWFNSDGSWDEQYYLTWKSDSTGWWVEDKSGWWPVSQWLKIDGSWYYFNGSGYMVTSQYVDGYWIDANGVCK